jgi:hypothetical protein
MAYNQINTCQISVLRLFAYPRFTNPIVEPDRSCGGFGLKIRGNISEAQGRHGGGEWDIDKKGVVRLASLSSLYTSQYLE